MVDLINKDLSWQANSSIVTLKQKTQTLLLSNLNNNEEREVKITQSEFIFLHFIFDNISGKLNGGEPYKKPTEQMKLKDVCAMFVDIMRHAPVYGEWRAVLLSSLDMVNNLGIKVPLYYTPDTLGKYGENVFIMGEKKQLLATGNCLSHSQRMLY